MNNVTHQSLAQIVGKKAGVPELDAFVAGAGLPDYVDDLLVKPVGQKYWKNKLLDYTIGPFQHFCKPIGRQKYNGYCMARDPSWPKEVRPPLGELKSYPEVWCDKLGMVGLGPNYHPMESILQVSTGKAPQQVTYCTAPVYADWIAKQICRPGVKIKPEVFWKGVGAIAHLAMDMCVWHHVFLCLLDGHQSYEGLIQEWAVKNRALIESWNLPTPRGPSEIRTILELMAEMTGARKSKPPCEWAVHRGFEVTGLVAAWAFEQLP